VAKLKDAEHLLRLAVVFAAGIIVFLLLRAHFVPSTFGLYGHYRGAALANIATRPVVYAGHKACKDCHAAQMEMKTAGKHARVNCEVCHGALAKHAEDPASVLPQLPDTKLLCQRCHRQELARPSAFPQVKIEEHSGDVTCNICHKPHSPSLKALEKNS
jgi:transcription elongation factor Elf1